MKTIVWLWICKCQYLLCRSLLSPNLRVEWGCFTMIVPIVSAPSYLATWIWLSFSDIIMPSEKRLECPSIHEVSFSISGYNFCGAVPYGGSPTKESCVEAWAPTAAGGRPTASRAELQQLPTATTIPATGLQQTTAAARATVPTCQANRRLQAQGVPGDDYLHPHHQLWQGAGYWWKLQDIVSGRTF